MLKFIRPSKSDAPRPSFPTVAANERVYVVGDVHGRHDLLIRLLRKIANDAAQFDDDRQFRLIFLGDYIDRGDDSRSVLSTLSALHQGDSQQITFLLGNHEAALLAFLQNPTEHKSWLNFGAAQTLASYGVPATRTRPSVEELYSVREALFGALGPHLGFLRTLEPLARSGDVIFAHAGLNPNRSLDDQRINDLIWGHPEFLTDTPLDGYRIVHGHYDDAEPLTLPGRLCVDTGAYYTGRLTAVRLDDTETFITADALD